MRNMLKATTLERKFPLLAVENGCIISKDADLTVAFRVELPELFTVTSAEYEAIHSAWYKAVKVLPDYSIVHKQDFFIKENYQPDTERDELSFLSRSFERHFNERPFHVPAAIAAWHSDAEGRVQGPYPVQDKQSQQSSKSPLQQHSCL